MSIGKRLRFRVLSKCKFRCSYCGRAAPDVVLEVDHVVPVSKGGSDEETNLTAACFDCNRGKTNMFVDPSEGLFVHWLLDQDKRQDRVGDLARDMLSTLRTAIDREEWFAQHRTFEKVEHQLWMARACPEAHDSLREAKEEYDRKH